MSFFADPPLLFVTGEAYARLAPEEAQGRVAAGAGAACLAVFWGVGAALYGSERGRDFMVNFPVLHIDARRPGRRMHVAAAAIFGLVYPLALWLGWDHGRRRRPRLR